MPMPLRIFIVQHAEKESRPGDPGLTESGHRQARLWRHAGEARHLRRTVEQSTTAGSGDCWTSGRRPWRSVGGDRAGRPNPGAPELAWRARPDASGVPGRLGTDHCQSRVPDRVRRFVTCRGRPVRGVPPGASRSVAPRLRHCRRPRRGHRRPGAHLVRGRSRQ